MTKSKEIVYSYDEFKAKVDQAKPVHHEGESKVLDKHGLVHRIWFRIYGIEKTFGHIVVFEFVRDINTMSKDFFEKWHGRQQEGLMAIYNELVDQYAKPLGSTEGKWR
jgi:hypothetical protein